MSTASLRELVEEIKTRGTSLASATGADQATPRDLVYLSTAVERLMGADALLELIDTASRPAEIVVHAAPGTGTITLSTDQVQKEVVVVKPDSGTYNASYANVVVPNYGWSFVLDNKTTVPLRVATATQSPAYVTVAPNSKGWLYCDGTAAEFVVDIAAITAALTTPMTTSGDLVTFDGTNQTRLSVGQNDQVLKVENGVPTWAYSGQAKHSRIRCPSNFFMGYNPDRTNNLGWAATEADGSEAATPVLSVETATNRLGNYITDNSYAPQSGGSPCIQINTGTWDVCHEEGGVYRGGSAISYDNGLWMWGSGTSGKNGDVSGNGRGPFHPSFYDSTSEGIPYVDDTNWDIKQVCTTYDWCAVVTTDGTVYCTGYGGQGQQGDGTVSSKNFFRKVNFPGGAGAVRYLSVNGAGGSANHCIFALMEDGDVYSWGQNNYGQLGVGDTTVRNTPTKISVFDKNVRCVMNGGYHVAFITNDHELYTCGLNTNGQCGNGTVTNINTPQLINIGGDVVKVAIDGDIPNTNGWTLALRADGRLYAFGYNAYGQLGDNSTTTRSSPTQVSNIGVDADKKVIDMWCVGGVLNGASFALTENGDFYAWGHNNRGQLGLGDTTDRATPTVHQTLKWVSDVQAAGQTNSTSYYYMQNLCVGHQSLQDRIDRVKGSVYVCGYYANPVIGRPGATVDQTSWNLVGFPNKVTNRIRFICTNGIHTSTTQEQNVYAIDEDGVIHFWGYDAAGTWCSPRHLSEGSTLSPVRMTL